MTIFGDDNGNYCVPFHFLWKWRPVTRKCVWSESSYFVSRGKLNFKFIGIKILITLYVGTMAQDSKVLHLEESFMWCFEGGVVVRKKHHIYFFKKSIYQWPLSSRNYCKECVRVLGEKKDCCKQSMDTIATCADDFANWAIRSWIQLRLVVIMYHSSISDLD